tara:strand:+ start:6579 stop:6821 length:243 start_codon:yes stop_codon:yes gene_type:complete
MGMSSGYTRDPSNQPLGQIGGHRDNANAVMQLPDLDPRQGQPDSPGAIAIGAEQDRPFRPRMDLTANFSDADGHLALLDG